MLKSRNTCATALVNGVSGFWFSPLQMFKMSKMRISYREDAADGTLRDVVSVS